LRQHAVVQTCGPQALTPAQRRFAVENDTETPAERHILRPASQVLLSWRHARLPKATHWSLISFATGLLAGTFLLTNGTSPLFRFWAGLFLLTSEILAVAGCELAGTSSVRSSHAEIVRALPPILIGSLFILGASSTASALEGSRWIWLLGFATGLSTIVQCAAFGGAKQQYGLGAGAGSGIRRETLLEISFRRHEAALRGSKTEELIWRAYDHFRRLQQSLVPNQPKGSADQFWCLNRKRISLWAVLGRRMNFVWLAAATLVSAFWPVAIVAVFAGIAVAGNLILLLLLIAGWKTRSVNA
jgi:hypothetical protein